MQLELISFKLCPFVQRAIIILKQQKIDYKITYINLMSPPDWFVEISPTKQVPLLKIDSEVIFESSVISEFVNDISGGNLLPKDPVQKAKSRAWIAFSSSIFGDLFNLVIADDAKFEDAKTTLFAKLTRLNAAKTEHKFFLDDNFSMLDAAIAPLFMRIAWINEFCGGVLALDDLDNLAKWSDNILALDVVQNSVVEGLDDVYYSNIEAREGHLASLLIS